MEQAARHPPTLKERRGILLFETQLVPPSARCRATPTWGFHHGATTHAELEQLACQNEPGKMPCKAGIVPNLRLNLRLVGSHGISLR
jgi:hypothetical protein